MDDPEEYAARGVISYRRAEEVMEEFRNEVKLMHGRIIDIGCGPGSVTREIILPRLPDDAVIVVDMNDPVKYSKIDDKQRSVVNDLMEEFRDEMKAMHGRILDIGCGHGITARDIILPLLPDDAVVVGIDKSPEMLEHAQENCGAEERLSFFQLNIETPELPKDLIGEYDNAVSFFCLHWCENIEAVCNNIYKLLKPGGTVLMVCVSHHITFDIFLEQKEKSKYSMYIQNTASPILPHYDHPNPEEPLKIYMQTAGFEVMHCTNRRRTFSFENMNSFMDFIVPLSPCLKEMPNDLKKEYMSDVKKIIVQKHLINENNDDANELPVVDEYSIIVAYCKKNLRKNMSATPYV